MLAVKCEAIEHYWGEALLAVVSLINILPSYTLQGDVPKKGILCQGHLI
jgi:hypothetical protein